jgi:hypothetical protein
MKGRHSAAALLVLLLTSTSAAALTIPWETRTGHQQSGPFGWDYSYDIGVVDDVLMIDVDIAFIGVRPRASLRNRWESGIEDIWSTDRFSIPIRIDVDWVKLDGITGNQDQIVTVRRGRGAWNMLTWYTGNPSGWGNSYHEEVAAHEFGHMLALFDEYKGSAIDPVTGRVNTGGLMETLDGPTLDYYYDAFLTWYTERLAEQPLAPYVSEPGALLLLGAGVIALLLLRPRSIRKPAGSAPRTSRRPIASGSGGDCDLRGAFRATRVGRSERLHDRI